MRHRPRRPPPREAQAAAALAKPNISVALKRFINDPKNAALLAGIAARTNAPLYPNARFQIGNIVRFTPPAVKREMILGIVTESDGLMLRVHWDDGEDTIHFHDDDRLSLVPQ